MMTASRRTWLAFTGSTLLSACGGGGDGADTGGSPPPPSSTGLTLSGPSTGVVNVRSQHFTVAADGPLSTNVVVTPSSGSGGGSFSPASITLTSTAPSATFTYTPHSAGHKTISVSNSHGLQDPAHLSFVVSGGSSASNPSFSHLADGRGADNASQLTTAPVTLLAHRLALLSVVSVASVPAVPTVAGWALVASHVVGSINRVSVFRRMASTDSTQSFVVQFGGQTQFFTRWSIDQSDTHINTSGPNGAGAVVQVKTGGAVGTVQNCLLTFDNAFSSASHSTFVAFGASASSAVPTAGSGFTELSRQGVEPFGERALFVQYKSAADTTVDMAWSAPYDVWTGVALEIAGAG